MKADDPTVLVRRVNDRHFAGPVQQLVLQSPAVHTDQFQLVDAAGIQVQDRAVSRVCITYIDDAGSRVIEV